MTEVSEPVYVCSACRSSLSRDETRLECATCRRSYPVADGVVDFVSGEYYDQFPPGAEPSEEDRVGLEHEAAGAIPRIRDFYLPKIESARRQSGRIGHAWRLLDCGCGNGLSVDLLNEAGVAATPGIDFDPIDGRHFLRFCYAGSAAEMHEAVERIGGWLKK